MSTYSSSIFNDLYSYSKSGGSMAVIPDLPMLRNNVAEGFKEIFAPAEFCTDPETPCGLLVDSIALMMYNTMGVVVQNMNGLNIDLAYDSYLDAIGNIFGVQRNGDSDDDYRRRILSSQSRGSGTSYSVRQALSNITSIDGFCVLENNTPYTCALPADSDNAVEVSGHSIYVTVIPNESKDSSGMANDVANALYETKAAGCGYSVSGISDQVKTVTITDNSTNSTNVVKFNVASKLEGISLEVEIEPGSYSGDDMEGDVSDAIRSLIRSRWICNVINKNQIYSAVSESAHATVSSVKIFAKDPDEDDSESKGSEVESIVIFPYEYLDPETVEIEVK